MINFLDYKKLMLKRTLSTKWILLTFVMLTVSNADVYAQSSPYTGVAVKIDNLMIVVSFSETQQDNSAAFSRGYNGDLTTMTINKLKNNLSK